MFVLDASVALAWCFKDEGGPVPGRILMELTRTGAIVPAVWMLEVANALLFAERRKRLTRGETDSVRAMLASLPIDLDDADPTNAADEALHVARQYELTVYDASYLELAVRKELPLATLDRRLTKSAVAMNVKLV